MQSLRFCEKCGASAAQEAVFCSQCGNTLPAAHFESAEKATGWRWFFGFSGRVNRRGFLVRELIVVGLSVFATAIAFTSLGSVAVVDVIIAIGIHVSSVVRRFHDQGKSGWSYFLLMIPFLNILIFIRLFLGSNNGSSNEHGQCPTGLEVGL